MLDGWIDIYFVECFILMKAPKHSPHFLFLHAFKTAPFHRILKSQIFPLEARHHVFCVLHLVTISSETRKQQKHSILIVLFKSCQRGQHFEQRNP